MWLRRVQVTRGALLLALVMAAGLSAACVQQSLTTAYLQQHLREDVQRGFLSIDERGSDTRLVATFPGMFASLSDSVQPPLAEMLDRIGHALRRPTGRILVISHSDSDPIFTLVFRNNLQLTKARAEAATRILAAVAGNPQRFTSVGKADSEPVADNRTLDGKARNRRLEILIGRATQ